MARATIRLADEDDAVSVKFSFGQGVDESSPAHVAAVAALETINSSLLQEDEGSGPTHHLKANSRGSWTNVHSFPASFTDQVKRACMSLLWSASGSVSFKIVDDKNVTLSALDARQQPLHWVDRS